LSSWSFTSSAPSVSAASWSSRNPTLPFIRGPEHRYAAVDIFTCGDVLRPKVAARYLAQLLGAARVSVVQLERGLLRPTSMARSRNLPQSA
jgi:hypothetical protein